ncbi:MAG: DUF5678 domain-containing protein [Candidatus Nanoarchaeia archaeon]
MKTTLELLKQAGRDIDWLQENGERINKEYAGSFIAVYNKKIVASGKKYGDIEKELERKRINQGEALVDWIPPKGEIIIYTPFFK